jgi:hypothetical protein
MLSGYGRYSVCRNLSVFAACAGVLVVFDISRELFGTHSKVWRNISCCLLVEFVLRWWIMLKITHSITLCDKLVIQNASLKDVEDLTLWEIDLSTCKDAEIIKTTHCNIFLPFHAVNLISIIQRFLLCIFLARNFDLHSNWFLTILNSTPRLPLPFHQSANEFGGSLPCFFKLFSSLTLAPFRESPALASIPA